MNKRELEEYETEPIKRLKVAQNIKKNSLDSDEEDDGADEDNYALDEDDIEGEEDGVSHNEGGVRTTAFNMREELEEGHFDKDGHFIWNKNNEIRDNWLDNIDWQEIKPTQVKAKSDKGLADDSDTDEDDMSTATDDIEYYKSILSYMQPRETIAKALKRLGGGNKKLSSIERLRLKKQGTLNTNQESITKLTELANHLLNANGNMDIYQETYEQIKSKVDGVSKEPAKPKAKAEELDMYSDDFGAKEQQKLGPGTSQETGSSTDGAAAPTLMWEYKVTADSEQIHGPFTTEKMQEFVDGGKFKEPVLVRKLGQEQFYTSARIDFELYMS